MIEIHTRQTNIGHLTRHSLGNLKLKNKQSKDIAYLMNINYIKPNAYLSGEFS